MTHLSLRDQDLSEEYYKLSLQQIRKMNVTHRFKRFLNNSARMKRSTAALAKSARLPVGNFFEPQRMKNGEH